MSRHVEWIEPLVGIAQGGEAVGEHQVDDGNIGIVFGFDPAAVFEGTPDEVRLFAASIMRAVELALNDKEASFGTGDLCEDDPDDEGRCAYHRTVHP